MEPNSELSSVPSDAGAADSCGTAAAPEAPAERSPDASEALAAKALEAERLQDRLLRLQAEFENYKRRAAREKAEFLKFAAEGLLLNFLPVLDNLERAYASAPADPATRPFVEGIDMIVRLFRTTLEKAGVTAIDAVGKPFNPDVHQAVAQVETPGGEDHQVLEEVQRGYLLEGRVLRPAMVKVSRRVAADEPAAEDMSA
jgi:molecular chaperone GrpE